jgi:hypothetical protein
MNMADKTAMTHLLPPSTAIRLAWALTGAFSVNNPESQLIASEAKNNLENIKKRAFELKEPEMSYVTNAAVDIDSTMRTLDTIYKGRELNITENDQLRKIYLDNIEESLKFGQSAKDVVKSLPAMAITTGAGTVTLNQLLSSFNLPAWSMWLIGLGMAGIGYIINLFFVWNSRKTKQNLYVRQDYERDLFYSQYLNRVRITLINLYNDIDRLHEADFDIPYPKKENETATKLVDDLLQGALPTMCKNVHLHMKSGMITPNMWSVCETGGNPVESCKFKS